MKKLSLIPSADGTQVTFELNGRKSPVFSSQSSALKALNAMYHNPPIGVKLRLSDVTPIHRQIKEMEKMPDIIPGARMETRPEISLAIETFSMGNFFSALIPGRQRGLAVMHTISITESTYYTGPEQSLEKPEFGRCFCDGAHYRFYFGSEWSRKFYSKDAGIVVYDELVRDGRFTDEDGKEALEKMFIAEIPEFDFEVMIRD